MKPTRVLTNIRPVAENLSGRCCGGHRHVHLVGGRARGAAAYPQRFCENVLKSIDVWVKQRRGSELLSTVDQECAHPDMCDPAEELWQNTVEHFDDSSGESLGETLDQEGCADEMRSFSEMGVYEYALRSTAQQYPNGRIDGVRWVEVNRGTQSQPVVR